MDRRLKDILLKAEIEEYTKLQKEIIEEDFKLFLASVNVLKAKTQPPRLHPIEKPKFGYFDNSCFIFTISHESKKALLKVLGIESLPFAIFSWNTEKYVDSKKGRELQYVKSHPELFQWEITFP